MSDDRPYFWTDDQDEIRRAFILDVMADADIDGKVLVSNMQQVFDWLKGNSCHSSPKRSKGGATAPQDAKP
jgi:hypothetical protein